MGSLMAGWDSPVSDPQASKFILVLISLINDK